MKNTEKTGKITGNRRRHWSVSFIKLSVEVFSNRSLNFIIFRFTTLDCHLLLFKKFNILKIVKNHQKCRFLAIFSTSMIHFLDPYKIPIDEFNGTKGYFYSSSRLAEKEGNLSRHKIRNRQNTGFRNLKPEFTGFL